MSSVAGELITETLAFDGGRQVTVCVPQAPVEAVGFAGDGHLVSVSDHDTTWVVFSPTHQARLGTKQEIERIEAMFVRQSFASEDREQWTCADARGLPWMEDAVSETAAC
jgi:hypothetical protein